MHYQFARLGKKHRINPSKEKSKTKTRYFLSGARIKSCIPYAFTVVILLKKGKYINNKSE